MGEIFSEHKKVVYFFVFLLIFYYLVIVPSEIIIDNIHNIEMKEKRIENITLKEKIIEKNIEKLKSQKEKLTEENRIFSEKQRSFGSAGEFQKYLNSFMRKNNIEIKEIGRSREEEGEFCVPYTVSGSEKDIFQFVKDTEQDINIMKESVEIEKFGDNLILRFSSLGKINILKDENINKNTREKDIFVSDNNTIKLVKYISAGKNRGIFYFRILGKTQRYYLADKKIIIVHKNEYKIFLNEEKLILTDIKNEKNRMIFNLKGENGAGEKFEKKD